MSDRMVELWISHPSLFGMPFHFWSVWVFIVGAFIGSFLNVCIHRMPREESIVRPPSHCPHCLYHIPALLNLPIITWLWLRGRCRNCGAPISPRYLAVEVLTGVTFLGLWLRFGDDTPAKALALCVLFALFIVATFIDFEHLIIPDEITLGGAAMGFVLSVAAPALHAQERAVEALKSSGLGIAAGAAVVYGVVWMGKLLFGRESVALPAGTRILFHEEGIDLPDRRIPFGDLFYRRIDVIRLEGERIELADRCYVRAPVSLTTRKLRIGDDEFVPEEVPSLEVTTTRLHLPREAMGMGDVKFVATIGAFLGWQATVFSLAVASLVGAVVGLGLIALFGRERSRPLPFGPFLALGAVIWVFAGWPIWRRFISF